MDRSLLYSQNESPTAPFGPHCRYGGKYKSRAWGEGYWVRAISVRGFKFRLPREIPGQPPKAVRGSQSEPNFEHVIRSPFAQTGGPSGSTLFGPTSRYDSSKEHEPDEPQDLEYGDQNVLVICPNARNRMRNNPISLEMAVPIL